MRWFLLFSIFTCAFLVGSIAQAAEARTWTSGKHKIDAELVKIDGDELVLKSVKSGKILRVPISKFSPADQAYIQDLIKKAKADPLPMPADGDKKKAEGDKKKTKGDEEGDDFSGGRPKGERRPPKPALDPSATLRDGQSGLVLPTEPSKWLRGNPISLESVGNRAIVFVLFDEKSTVNVRRWARWANVVAKYKYKPILFIAVSSGNSRGDVKLAVQKYKISWPTIVDSNRQFESHLNCRTVGRSYPYIIRVVNGKGKFYYGSTFGDDALETSIHTALNGAKWQVNPKGMPGGLRKAWANIENARYHAAAADVAKALASKKSKIKKFAKKLDAKIAYHVEGIVGEALYQEDQDNKFAALRIYNELLQDYAGYPLDKRIKTTVDRMSKDPDLQGEIAAMDEFYAAKKVAIRSSASARRRGIAKLENILRDFPDTLASDEAEQLIERLQR